MFASFLITFREVIEASFVVATVYGILLKTGQKNSLNTMVAATINAILVSILLLLIGSRLGYNMHTVYSGKTEELAEGILMTISAVFITWAVFFLHTYFNWHKKYILNKIKDSIFQQEQNGLYWLVFFAVFREGFEIVLFLSSMYLSVNPSEIMIGFAGGLIVGLLCAFLITRWEMGISIRHAMAVSTILLLLFAAGLLARGLHEFAEAGVITEYLKITIPLIPSGGTMMGDLIKSVFGVSRQMDIIPLLAYGGYLGAMTWHLKRNGATHG